MTTKTLPVLLISILLLPSCFKENCDGFDKIHSFDQLVLTGPDSIVQKSGDTVFLMGLNLDETLRTRDGDRNCRQLDLAFKMEDAWDSTRFSLTCEQALQINGNTVPARTELMGQPGMINRIKLDGLNTLTADSKILLQLDRISSPAQLQFAITGVTLEGKVFGGQHTVKVTP